MRYTMTFLISALVYLALIHRAEASVCLKLISEVSTPFVDTFETDYQPLMCSDNVLKFKSSLAKRSFDSRRAQVVLIRHRLVPYRPILPKQARTQFEGKSFPSPRWTFHVFATIDGLVFDMDFHNHPATLGLYPYLGAMFGDDSETFDYIAQVKNLDQFSETDLYGELHGGITLPFRELAHTFRESPCGSFPLQYIGFKPTLLSSLRIQ